jgi:hypothetical protein
MLSDAFDILMTGVLLKGCKNFKKNEIMDLKCPNEVKSTN